MTDFQGFYEAGLSVEIYDTMFDEEFTQQLGDVRFYSEYAKKDSLIIELGSGTGRVSCALAELGYKVLGIENSDAMLNIANAKRKGLKQKGFIHCCTVFTKAALQKKPRSSESKHCGQTDFAGA